MVIYIIMQKEFEEKLEQLFLKTKGISNKDKSRIILYCESLSKNDLPIIFDMYTLCEYFDIDYFKFKYYYDSLYKDSSIVYKKFKILKKNNKGYREILVPCKELYNLQKKILDSILLKLQVSNQSMAFSKGNSIVNNAKVHLNCEVAINYDLKNFFGNIKYNQVKNVFFKAGYTNDLAKVFARMCCYNGYLPQGAPTSPYLSNLVAKDMDKELYNLALCNNANYTRYADDITFSGKKQILCIQNLIKEIISKYNFIINENKTNIRYYSQGITVTGINIFDGKLHVNKNYLKTFEKEIYFCLKYGVAEHLKHEKIDKAFYKEHMYGKAYFINMIDHIKGEKLLTQLNKILWER